jgi:hypothetical protein
MTPPPQNGAGSVIGALSEASNADIGSEKIRLQELEDLRAALLRTESNAAPDFGRSRPSQSSHLTP